MREIFTVLLLAACVGCAANTNTDVWACTVVDGGDMTCEAQKDEA